MKLTAVVAVSENGVIGREGALPWRIPEDLREFKRITMGKPIVMGRKTFESIGRALPGRRNCVLTRSSGWSASGVEVYASWNDLKAALRASAIVPEEVMIIGGGEIYNFLWAEIDRVILTLVHQSIEGDARLESYPSLFKEFRETSRVRKSQTEPQPLEFSFIVLERISSQDDS